MAVRSTPGLNTVAIVLCLLAFYSVSLYRTNRIWREAAVLSLSIMDEMASAASPTKSIIVVNAPDNLRGVPIFHNGLEDALRVFQKEGRIEDARVLSLHDIHSLSDEIELKREGGTYNLRLLNHAATFTKIADGLDCVEVRERSGLALDFRLNNCPDKSALFFFNAGRIYRVIDDGKDNRVP